jgi:hypothetical protein
MQERMTNLLLQSSVVLFELITPSPLDASQLGSKKAFFLHIISALYEQ